MYLDTIKQVFMATSGIALEQILACTEQEVCALEDRLGTPLPAAYREWLLWMGHGAGSFLQGTDVFYDDDLVSLKEGALELLRENQLEAALPADALVFYLHQGYFVQFLRLSEGDNPPVYGYAEGGEQAVPSQWYDNLATWLAEELAAHLQAAAHH